MRPEGREDFQMRVVCMIENEDYWNLDSIIGSGGGVESYGYRFIAEDPSGSAAPSTVVVFELANATFSVGLIVSNSFNETDMELGFICQQVPDKQIPVKTSVSEEVKKIQKEGDELQRIEYVGLSLEKFYENSGAKFYLLDMRGQG